MSTDVTKQAATKEGKIVEYTPLGGKTPVQLSIGMVRSFICTPTKSGKVPNDADIVKFMMLCKARELDPWVGDAYLCGYDAKDGPQFSLITSVQALYKRAEMSEFYDGIESGVIIKTDKGIEFRQGDLLLNGEVLVGGWARCFRKDRSHPEYDALNFSTFDTGYSRWAKDPAGMIVKCAEASVLRKAFPTQLGGLYTREEMEQISDQRMQARQGSTSPVRVSNLDALALPQVTPPEPQRIEEPRGEQPRREQAESQQADDDEQGDQHGQAEGHEQGQKLTVEQISEQWLERIGKAKKRSELNDINAELINGEKRLTNDQKMPIVEVISKKLSTLKNKAAQGDMLDQQ